MFHDLAIKVLCLKTETCMIFNRYDVHIETQYESIKKEIEEDGTMQVVCYWLID